MNLAEQCPGSGKKAPWQSWKTALPAGGTGHTGKYAAVGIERIKSTLAEAELKEQVPDHWQKPLLEILVP